jgi:hypothetical protein
MKNVLQSGVIYMKCEAYPCFIQHTEYPGSTEWILCDLPYHWVPFVQLATKRFPFLCDLLEPIQRRCAFISHAKL